MKKKILMIILCIMFIPVLVNAKDNCTVVSGNGENIGDEIKCGTESFYIVKNDGDNLSLLAKYNLLVGDKIDYFDLDEIQTFDTFWDASDFCYEEAERQGYNAYYTYPMSVDNTGSWQNNYETKGCRVYERIEYDKVVQDERAVGTKLVNGKSVLPLYGIVYMNSNWEYEASGEWYENEYDNNGDLIISTTPFGKYLDGYKEELKRQNIDVQEVSFIHLSRTIELLEAVSGKEIEVDIEYPDEDEWYEGDYEFFYGKMDIKDIVGEKNKWIYDTTYWLGSGFIGDPDKIVEDIHNDYYISNEGFLCAIGRGECTYFIYPIGNGIRPLVIIPKSEVKKPIVNPETGNIAALIIILMISFISIGFYTYKNKNIK